VNRLIEEMKSGMGSASFLNLFAGVNVEKATAFKESDQVAIKELLVAVGVKRVNDMIMNSLKEWLLSVANQGLEQAHIGTSAGTNLLNAKASLHRALVCSVSFLILWKTNRFSKGRAR